MVKSCTSSAEVLKAYTISFQLLRELRETHISLVLIILGRVLKISAYQPEA